MRLNDSEWTLMRALWGHSPATAREVHGRVEAETGWSYSTVRTLLTRLAAKGALQETKEGKQLSYEPKVSQDEARRSALRSLVDKAFGGTFGSLVAHMAAEEQLSPAQRAKLASLLEEDTKGAAKGRRRR